MRSWSKLVIGVGLLFWPVACGGPYDLEKVSGRGSVKDCELAPLVYRALEEPDAFMLKGFAQRFDGRTADTMIFRWSTEPKHVQTVVSWRVPERKGSAEEHDRRMKDLLQNMRGPLGVLSDNRGEVSREILDSFPWTAQVKSEQERDGQRIDIYWSGILLHADCIVSIATWGDTVIPTPATWIGFRKRVEKLRRALASSVTRGNGMAVRIE